ncbi:hypothetical protein Daus18300_010415 [Diaporthe australafricana]|uniref:Uncharacterized protein n=1 Tax=Diaporthe australafricana TaxID=127596 RepID=A0ABR3WAS9_9PEZI
MSADNGAPNYEGESIAGFPDFVEGYLLAIEEPERQENDNLDFEMMDMDVLQDEFENLLASVAPVAPLPLLPPMAPLAPSAPEVPYLEYVDMDVNDLNFDLLEHGLPENVEPVFENDDDFLSLTLFGVAEDIEEHDVPQACVSDCRGLIDLSAKCENSTEGDSAFNDCVCNDTGAESALNSCAACAKQNDFTANDDNDVASLMTDCGLDFNAASASDGSTTAGAATSTITSVSGSSTVVLTTTSAQSAATQSSESEVTSAAAAHPTAGLGAVVAGLALGIPVLI